MNSTGGKADAGADAKAEAEAEATAEAGADAATGSGTEAGACAAGAGAASAAGSGAARGARRRRTARKAATVIAVAAACSGLTWTALSLTGAPSDSKPASPTGCSYTATGTGTTKAPGLPVHDPARARPYTAELVTDRGKVVIEAFTGAAPCSTTSFAFLAGKKYFDGSACHRVTTRGIFVLECGDPAGLGTADPGYYFPDENLADASYPAGTVAMSKAVPGRNGSQFFISYADPDFRMQPDWTPFARVVSGLDVLRRIAGNGTEDGSPDGRPKEPVVIRSVTVHPSDRG
ncbi:peptidylprolyl isomerase [Streptomyces sp. NBC_00435]|uniref:peptidylprolyl isomerase n=1 Tax=Streptomyces sp. NBC_00435 TaxID=2903649 RepID=UPI002E1AE15F